MFKRAAYLLTVVGLLSLMAAQPAIAQSEVTEPTNCGTYKGREILRSKEEA